ncbi:MAG: HAD family hydrolase [Phycisphaerae bacterium]
MPRAVIFDLDGTLTLGGLDFDMIRAQIGLYDEPILEALEGMDPGRRAAAETVLYDHERTAAETALPRDGAAETIVDLRRRGFAVGILTRNARQWARITLDRLGIEVDALRCREDGAIKPDPAGLLDLCARFNAAPAASWMVGDYLFDIESGRRAGLRTVLVVDDEPPYYANRADFVIRSLPAILELVAS